MKSVHREMYRNRSPYLSYDQDTSSQKHILKTEDNCDRTMISLQMEKKVNAPKFSATRNIEMNIPTSLSAIPKNLASKLCHCEKSKNSYLQTSVSATASTTTSSQRRKISTYYLQAFFTIVFLFFIISNEKVSATPLRKLDLIRTRHITTFESGQTKSEASWSLLHNIQKLNRPTQGHQMIANLFARNRRSTDQCAPAYLNLYSFLGYAYNETTNAINRRRRRSRPNSHRSWGERYLRNHETLKKVFCEMKARPNLFDETTSSIRNTIESMIASLQQEMNQISISFTPVYPEDCLTRYPQGSDHHVATRIKNDLYGLQREFLAICSHIQRH